jgi:hypothetical protein
MIDMENPAIVSSIITVAGGGICALLGWLGKTIYDSVKARLGKVEATLFECISNLPRCFADKTTTETRLNDHDRRLDEHGERITRVETRQTH